MQKKFAQLAKLQFVGDFLPFAFHQSLMKLTLGVCTCTACNVSTPKNAFASIKKFAAKIAKL
jgi:hypothetical protein